MKISTKERLIIAGLNLAMLGLIWLAILFSYKAIPVGAVFSDMQECLREQGQTKVNFVDSE